MPAKHRTAPLKRVLDVLIAVPLFICLLPFFVAIALIVRLDSAGPAFFIQDRAGYQGRVFRIYKFRTMQHHKDESGTQVHLDDPRVTRVGRVLRRLKIDELPQLWNVVKGDMSLVGPRPTLPEQVIAYDEQQRRRLDVLPGITGWAQVNGNIRLTWQERIDLDLWYVDHWSIWLDIRILALTLVVIMHGEIRCEEALLERTVQP